MTHSPDLFSVADLCNEIERGWRPKYIFFWGHTSQKPGQVGRECLSQWWSSAFVIDDISYPTAEHYMMASKARLFGDYGILEQILSASHPGQAKALGRQVTGFVEEVWQKSCFDIVVHGNWAKFGQNEALKSYLLSTRNRVLVEASPRDRFWGIGVAANDERAEDPNQWQGQNLLGFALMKVWSLLLSELQAEK